MENDFSLLSIWADSFVLSSYFSEAIHVHIEAFFGMRTIANWKEKTAYLLLYFSANIRKGNCMKF